MVQRPCAPSPNCESDSRRGTPRPLSVLTMRTTEGLHVGVVNMRTISNRRGSAKGPRGTCSGPVSSRLATSAPVSTPSFALFFPDFLGPKRRVETVVSVPDRGLRGGAPSGSGRRGARESVSSAPRAVRATQSPTLAFFSESLSSRANG